MRARRHTRHEREQGFALLLSLVALAILAVLVTDLHETTGMSFSAAMAERDQLRAEYLAKSGVNLTRMLIGQERNLRQLVSPIYQMAFQRRAPQLPVWAFADMILKPFEDFESSKEDVASAGYDLGLAKGLGETGGTFEIIAFAENGKININDPRTEDVATGQANVASQVFALMGGTKSPSKYDALFSKFDEKGRLTTRQDVVGNIIDWWDRDEQRLSFDPVMGQVQSSGAEVTDYYRSLPEPYNIKNAPFDTIEELRLVHGISDDIWATFVEPDPEDSRSRQVTIYGVGKVNPNEAPPPVILARMCTFPEFRQQALCADPVGVEQLKFVTLLSTARAIAPVPWFSKPQDFIDFITGKPEGLFGKLQNLLKAMNGGATMMFTPLSMPEAGAPPQPNTPQGTLLQRLRRTFTTSSGFFSIESTATVGRSQRRIRTVINIDPRWTPPQGNSVKLPPLGIFSYYRLD